MAIVLLFHVERNMLWTCKIIKVAKSLNKQTNKRIFKKFINSPMTCESGWCFFPCPRKTEESTFFSTFFLLFLFLFFETLDCSVPSGGGLSYDQCFDHLSDIDASSAVPVGGLELFFVTIGPWFSWSSSIVSDFNREVTEFRGKLADSFLEVPDFLVAIFLKLRESGATWFSLRSAYSLRCLSFSK